jgi:hypothetical protein
MRFRLILRSEPDKKMRFRLILRSEPDNSKGLSIKSTVSNRHATVFALQHYCDMSIHILAFQ